MQSHFTAVYDACVLYSDRLRDFLMQLAQTDLFRARWSEDILEEMVRSVCRKRPDIPEARMRQVADLMCKKTRDALVDPGRYRPLVNGLTLPDPDDRHVLAAAMASGAEVIVTHNLKDFPVDYLEPLGIEAQTPDEFVANVLDLDEASVLQCAELCRARLKRPPFTFVEYVDSLRRNNLNTTADRLAELHLLSLAGAPVSPVEEFKTIEIDLGDVK